MRYILFCLLLTSCKDSVKHYAESTVDVSKLPDCSNDVLNTKDEFVTFNGDDGSVLYIATHSDYACLKRNK